MYSKKSPLGKHNFRIKLLSGNNVVLVELDGYETEIFVPEMQHGRITFQNIVPNRRCCYQAQLQSAAAKLRAGGSRQIPGMPSSEGTLLERKPLGSPTNINKFWRMTAGQDMHGSHSQMASSTPHKPPYMNTGKENIPRSRPDRPSIESSSQRSNHSASPPAILQPPSLTPPTPEQSRRTPLYAIPSPMKVVQDTLVKIPPGIRVIRLYRNSTACVPKRSSRVLSKSDQRQNTSRSPLRVIEMSKMNLQSTPRTRKNSVIIPPTETKWRKYVTPIRTYARHSNSVNRAASGGTIKKVRKVGPSCIANPTQGVKGTHHLEVRKRKLIMDAKKTISPRSIKKRQNATIDTEKPNNTTAQLPATRSEYERNKSTAFDLLTNSNRSCMSSKLSQQFSRCCVNKTLSTVPPLDSEEAARVRRQHAYGNTATALAERAAAQILSKIGATRTISTNSQQS